MSMAEAKCTWRVALSGEWVGVLMCSGWGAGLGPAGLGCGVRIGVMGATTLWGVLLESW